MSLKAIVQPLQRFLATEAAGGVLLLVGMCAALVWANSPWSATYERVWNETGFRHWINDGLMTLFFFVVGLEIKRELVSGELASPRKAFLPVIAAAGGMIVPAVLFLAINGGADTARGWAIPTATDIAFAAGALALVGSKLAKSVKVFLLSLAIVDDIGAIVVIAVFYAGAVKWGPLVAVGLALVIPARRYGERLEDWLHPWASFAIVPLFALANAGVSLSGDAIPAALTSRLGLGIVVSLVAGKLLGVGGATFVARRAGMHLPEGAGGRDIAGVAALTGIGFTVSLFITGLAFTDATHVATAKVGILAGSLLASTLGALILRPGRTLGSLEDPQSLG